MSTLRGPIPTYIGRCCREWELMIGGRGRCGLCGEVPKWIRNVDPADYPVAR